MTTGAPVDAERLLAGVRARHAEITGLARRLVAIPSDHPAHDERAAIVAVRSALAANGLPRGEIHAALPERPNLLVRMRGRRPGPVILLNGHVDTKPAGDPADWPTDPWAADVQDGVLRGLGSADMKGSVAAMLHAAAALSEAGIPHRGELLLAFTADEEADGTFGLGHLVPAAGLRPDAAVIGEPSGIDRSFDMLSIGSRGFVGFTLVASGPRVHSALSDRLDGPTAVGSLVRVLDGLPRAVDFGGPWPELFADGPTLTAATSLAAGVAPGIVPGRAVATGDVRTVPGQTRADVAAALRQAIDRIAEESGAALDVEVVLDAEDWPATAIDPRLPLVAALRAATKAVTGVEPRLGAFPGATEAHVLDRLGIPCVPAFGPGLLRRAHVPGKSVPIADLHAAAGIYALAIASLLG